MPLGAAVGGLVARSFGLLAALRWLPRSVVEQAEAAAPPPLG